MSTGTIREWPFYVDLTLAEGMRIPQQLELQMWRVVRAPFAIAFNDQLQTNVLVADDLGCQFAISVEFQTRLARLRNTKDRFMVNFPVYGLSILAILLLIYAETFTSSQCSIYSPSKKPIVDHIREDGEIIP
ncbi:hypothetical protein DFS33DRAFT_1276863 [Desarmillaria ectypa]|nr:hypothetical protein DFS33DRAFT_1276863 [Desarmillaria ectypa]